MDQIRSSRSITKQRPLGISTIAVLIVCQLTAGVSARANTPSEEAPTETAGEGFLWDEIQPNTSAQIAGFANFDGQPGEEVLIDAQVGGFYVTGEDGTFLWRHESGYWMPPIIVPDVDGDERPDVLAQTIRHQNGSGLPTADRRAVLLSGATGDMLWQTTTPEIEGYGTPAAADLNADGEVDIVLPGFKNFLDPQLKTVIQVFFGPDFSSGWVEPVPGVGIYLDGSFQGNRRQSIAVGNLDKDASAEVVVGSSEILSSTSGFLTALEGESGAEKWSVQTAGMRSVTLNGGSVVAFGDHSPTGGTLQLGGELASYAGSDGSLEWAHTFTGNRISGPLLVGDLDGIDGKAEVIFANARYAGATPGTSEPSLHAFSAEGIPRWRLQLERAPSSVALIPRAGGGADVGYGTFQAWDRDFVNERIGLVSGLTGAPLWRLVHEAEAGRDGIDGVGSADVDGDAIPEFIFTTTDHHLTALDLGDGTVRFERSYPGVWTAASAADLDEDGVVDVVGGGVDGLVRAVDGQDHRDLWSQPVGGSIARLVVREGSVLGVRLGRRTGVFSLDARSGEVRWDLDLGDARLAYGFDQMQTAVGDLNRDGMEDALVAVVEGDLQVPPGFEPEPRRAVVPPTIVAVDGATGEILWKIESQLPEYIQLSIVEGSVVVAASDRDTSRVRLSLVDGSTGTQRWAIEVPRNFVDTALRLEDLILVPVGDGIRQPLHNVVNAYRTSDGTLAWSRSFECDLRFIPTGTKVIAINPSHLECSGEAPLSILDGDGNLQEVDPGPLDHDQIRSVWVTPGSGSVHVFSLAYSGLDPTGHPAYTTMGVSLVDLEALLAGSVKVLREFRWAAGRFGVSAHGNDGHDVQITETTSGLVATSFTDFSRTGAVFGAYGGEGEPYRAWALLLPQEVSE